MTENVPLLPLRYADSFRDYQKRAVRMVRRYRELYRATRTGGAALVCHPTGTGKTAVIAALAHGSPEIGSVVVLTTREAIRDQLVRELSGSIFVDPEKMALSERIRLPKATFAVQEGRQLTTAVAAAKEATFRLLPGALKPFAESQVNRLVQSETVPLISLFSGGQVILVLTVQMLDCIQRRFARAYASLSREAGLVIFDEGHYEPAAQWSKVVRGLARPLVLLSATPFRNDLRPFEIREENIDIYRYALACDENRVRRVEVVRRNGATDPAAFCADVLAFCGEQFGGDRSAWPRVIIHCDTSNEITRLGREFIGAGFEVIGIHDTFPVRDQAEPWRRRSVPPPRDTNATIWIHQYKLMEGIDDHRFRVLAFFQPLTNVRWVVQQVGRIIRRTPGEPGEPAFVLDHFNGRIAEYWSLYEDYDASLTPAYLAQSLAKRYIEAFTRAHPRVDYFDRKFRRQLIFDKVGNGAEEILFERRVTFRRLAGVAIREIAERIEEDFASRDLQFAKWISTAGELLYLYVGLVNPPFLQSHFFAEARHGARLVLLLPDDGLVAFFDTDGQNGGAILGMGSASAPEGLEGLLTPGRQGRVTNISSQNTSLGSRVIRRRTISAPSIADTPPILDEHSHVLSTITGYNGDRARIVDDLAYPEAEVDEAFEDRAVITGAVDGRQTDAAQAAEQEILLRRYIGLANGHVSEIGPPLRLRAYRQWVLSLAAQMKAGSRTPGVFHRYAQPAGYSAHSSMAKNLLLDLYDIADQFIHAKTREPVYGDDLCIDRIGGGVDRADESTATFEVVLNGEKHALEVIFRKRSGKYRIESPGLDEAFVSTVKRTGRRKFTQILTDQQAFNIIPDNRSVIYVHGRFYAPTLKFGSHFDPASFFVGRCLYPSAVLKGLSEEKGRHVLSATGSRARSGGANYDPGSIFGLIDSWCGGFDTQALRIDAGWHARYKPETFSFNPTLVICDDMGKESADFILADEAQQRVVIVHAKASSTWRPFSASAVQEVCAQAQKNTALLAMFSLQPPDIAKWDKTHQFTGAAQAKLSIRRRIRKPLNVDAATAWTRLKPLLQNPLATREVWLLLGNMLSAGTLAKNLQSDDPAPETLQLNHLLQVTIASIGAASAKVRIFCAP